MRSKIKVVDATLVSGNYIDVKIMYNNKIVIISLDNILFNDSGKTKLKYQPHKIKRTRIKHNILKEFTCTIASILSDDFSRYYTPQSPRRPLYKDFYVRFNIAPKKLLSIIRAKVIKTEIAPISEYINGFSYRLLDKSGDLFFIIKRTNRSLRYLEQAKKDGLVNLYPLIILFGEDPQTLKLRFGKSTWKKLANSSKSRNYKIVQTALQTSNFFYSNSAFRSGGNAESHINRLLNVPTTWLCTIKIRRFLREGFGNDLLMCAINICRQEKIITKEDESNKIIMLAIDTYKLNRELGIEQIRWPKTSKSLEALHDRLAKDLERRKYSKKPFSWIKQLPRKTRKLSSLCCRSVELLQSPYDIHQAAKQFHNCVTGYMKDVVSGEYLIYIINNDHMAMYNVKDKEWEQVYKPCNKAPDTKLYEKLKSIEKQIKTGQLEEKPHHQLERRRYA